LHVELLRCGQNAQGQFFRRLEGLLDLSRFRLQAVGLSRHGLFLLSVKGFDGVLLEKSFLVIFERDGGLRTRVGGQRGGVFGARILRRNDYGEGEKEGNRFHFRSWPQCSRD
jgi:hypothetical protein